MSTRVKTLKDQLTSLKKTIDNLHDMHAESEDLDERIDLQTQIDALEQEEYLLECQIEDEQQKKE